MAVENIPITLGFNHDDIVGQISLDDRLEQFIIEEGYRVKREGGDVRLNISWSYVDTEEGLKLVGMTFLPPIDTKRYIRRRNG